MTDRFKTGGKTPENSVYEFDGYTIVPQLLIQVVMNKKSS
ncbi:hypothetical protein JOC86_004282 [Bacillus pakistanensis]|uniref:Uncharacterized protein n=1 Tax=Rossellomorea pakistanensis TaxID=992288 RepID=A0ABS2NIR2_9BACI|nr:hypothetical protein [Bacillus pakistanensis]